MLMASNPTSKPEQKRMFLDQLLDQIDASSSSPKSYEEKTTCPNTKSKENDTSSHQKVLGDNFQQIVLDYFVRVMDGMNELKNEIKTVANDTKIIKSVLLRKGDVKVMNCKQLAEKYSYTIPLPTVEEFERFDKELEDSTSSLRSDLISVLPSGLDSGLVMSKCIVKMLKMFITKDVAVQFTAVKQAKGKKIMKITNLFSCIEALIKERRSELNMSTSDKEMTAALSVVMTNAQHWHKRTQQQLVRPQSDQEGSAGSSQNELLNTYEVLTMSESDPLFEIQFPE